MTNTQSQPVLVNRFQDVLFVTLNRPGTRNALSAEMVEALEIVAAQVQEDQALRAVVLRGANQFFCAGGDVGNFQARLDETTLGHDPVAQKNRKFGQFLQALGRIPVPVISVVEGAAMGGGLGLACLSDIVLATEQAKFVLSETSLGIVPAQIMPFVVSKIGSAHSKRMGLTAERVSGQQSLRLGLVDALAIDSDQLDTVLANWLTNIGKCAPRANRLMKAMATDAMTQSQDVFQEQASNLFSETMRDEGKDGISAFRARVPAPWCVIFSVDDIRKVYENQGVRGQRTGQSG